MNFVFGGRFQGKLEYAKGLYGRGLTVADLRDYNDCNYVKAAEDADILVNLHEAIKTLIIKGESPWDYFNANIESFRGNVLIGDEIGCGIVPIDPILRDWRDETGRIYQLIASKAERVDRVWAGIGQKVNE